MTSVTSRTAARILRLLPRERITRALGHITDAKVPSVVLDPVLRWYTRAYQVDLSEAETPVGGFESFNQFFTRKLRRGARTIDQRSDVVVSPADGRLDDVGTIADDRTFLVKGQTYRTDELLASERDARDFSGGAFMVVYLSPRDYHRVHAPIEGTVVGVRHVPGSLFPVNDLGVRHVPWLFARNERVVITMNTHLGRVAVVMVGAMIVGRITLTVECPARPAIHGAIAERWFDDGSAPKLEKGEELGAFQLGSTVVLLLAPPNAGRYDLAGARGAGPVRLGQSLVERSNG